MDKLSLVKILVFVVSAMILLVVDLTLNKHSSESKLKSAKCSQRIFESSCVRQHHNVSCIPSSKCKTEDSVYGNRTEKTQSDMIILAAKLHHIKENTLKPLKSVKVLLVEQVFSVDKILRVIFVFVQIFVILVNIKVKLKLGDFHESYKTKGITEKETHASETESQKTDKNKWFSENETWTRSEEVKPNKTMYDFIFDFHEVSIGQSLVYPTSLDRYFSDVFSSNDSKCSEHFKYEWVRYESFKTFPESAAMMPLVLAKEGFYYTGKDDEVTCYSCGLTHHGWKQGDSVHEIHRKSSKNCKIITGVETNNISITGSKQDVYISNSGSACGGPSDVINDKKCTIDINEMDKKLSLYVVDRNKCDKFTEEKLSKVAEEQNVQATELQKNGKYTAEQQNISNMFDQKKDKDTDAFTGQAKHPQYANDSVRLSSYSKWPSSVEQSPQQLCDAGFFYGGFSDCVRCFFCGGGLRNWEYGDTPWIEHARWYPNCKFVRRNKGQSFIEMQKQDNDNESDIFPQETSKGSIKQHGSSASNSSFVSEQERPKHKYNILKDEHSSKADDNPERSNLSTDCQSLIIENRQLKEQMTCKICMDNNACMVFLPCGHMVTCQSCARTIRKCCICRTLIKDTVKAYF